jgi:hypothetical protein
MVSLVWDHEGTSARESGSHVDTFLREFERLSRLHGEELVNPAYPEFNLLAVIDAWVAAAKAYSRKVTDTAANPLDGRLRCECNYTYGPGAT